MPTNVGLRGRARPDLPDQSDLGWSSRSAVAAHHCGFNPSAFAMPALVLISWAICASKSCSMTGKGVMPFGVSLSATVATFKAAATSLANRSMIRRYVAAGASSPTHTALSLSLKPASVVVGVSASAATRAFWSITSARSLPSRMNGSAVPIGQK